MHSACFGNESTHGMIPPAPSSGVSLSLSFICFFVGQHSAAFQHIRCLILIKLSYPFFWKLSLIPVWSPFGSLECCLLYLYRTAWFYSPAASIIQVCWNKGGAEEKHSIRSERVQNKPRFGHKGLSEGVLLWIWDRLQRKLLFQRTTSRRKNTRECGDHSTAWLEPHTLVSCFFKHICTTWKICTYVQNLALQPSTPWFSWPAKIQRIHHPPCAAHLIA